MTVSELIAELNMIRDPESTLVVLTESEVDEPREFVALDSILHGRFGT